jgi:hypothetical protein
MERSGENLRRKGKAWKKYFGGDRTMKPLFLILAIAVLLFAANVRAATCPCEVSNCSFPGLTPYQSDNVYRGEQANGCSCPVGCDGGDGSTFLPADCRSGGSIDISG